MTELSRMYVALHVQPYLNVSKKRRYQPLLEKLATPFFPEDAEKQLGIPSGWATTLHRMFGNPVASYLQQYGVKKEAWLAADCIASELSFRTRFPFTIGNDLKYFTHGDNDYGLSLNEDQFHTLLEASVQTGVSRLENHGFQLGKEIKNEFVEPALQWMCGEISDLVEKTGTCNILDVNVFTSGSKYTLILPKR